MITSAFFIVRYERAQYLDFAKAVIFFRYYRVIIMNFFQRIAKMEHCICAKFYISIISTSAVLFADLELHFTATQIFIKAFNVHFLFSFLHGCKSHIVLQICCNNHASYTSSPKLPAAERAGFEHITHILSPFSRSSDLCFGNVLTLIL